MSPSDALRTENHSPFTSLGSRLGTVGMLTIFCGVVALVWPDTATLVINYFVGALLVVAGALQLSGRGIRVGRRWLALVTGVLYIAAGVLLFLRPIAGVISLTLLFTWMLVISGAFRLAAVFSGEVQSHRFLAGLSGVVSILVGWFSMQYLPAVAPWMLGLFFGTDMLFIGFALFGMAQQVKAIEPLPRNPVRTPL